jgi:hypothetical protein
VTPLRAVMLLVAALLVVSIDHGLPQRYVPDDHAVTCALGIARDFGNPELSRLAALVPPAGQYTTYPYLLPYAYLAAVGATYAGGRLTGAWHGAGEFGERVFEDPTIAWLPARLVVVLLTLLLPWATARAARELGAGRGEAALAALLAGSALLVVQSAHTTRPWAPLAAFVALTLAASLRLARSRRARDVLLASGAAALAASTHPVGVLAFGLPVLACLLWRPGVARAAPGVAAGVALTLLVGYPHYLVYRQDTGRGAIAGQLGNDGAVELGGQAFDLGAFGAERLPEMLAAWVGYEPVLLLCGLAGLLMLRRRVPDRRVWLVLAPVGVLALLFLPYDGTHVRYLMPATTFLALGAARMLAAMAARGGAARAAAMLLLALPLVQAARLDQLLGCADTRDQAARSLPAVLPPDARVAVDGYGPPLEPTAASVTAIGAHVWTTRTERRRADLAAAGLPDPQQARFLVPVGRFWRFDSYYATDFLDGEPTELGNWMDAWDITHYVQVDRLPDEARRQPVTDLTAARGTLLVEFSPTGSSPPGEAALPTEMAFPLAQLWRAERPGPWIRCWRLGASRP